MVMMPKVGYGYLFPPPRWLRSGLHWGIVFVVVILVHDAGYASLFEENDQHGEGNDGAENTATREFEVATNGKIEGSED